MHCHSGVEKGIKKGGNPIEVMGLMIGCPDPDSPHTLVVTDIYPLPIEGFETRVVADDDSVINYMIRLSDSIEKTRREKLMGWYHSHPFDVGIRSHSYLSQTDVTTQLLWQNTEDPNGFPFLAIVLDPLRSLAKNIPELKAFRVYPPTYTAPPNECPDGSVVTDNNARLEVWGSCWNRYYELEIEYFISSSASKILGTLTQNFLWMRTLGHTPMLESEYRERWPERVNVVADRIKKSIVAIGEPVGSVTSAGKGSSSTRTVSVGTVKTGPSGGESSDRVDTGTSTWKENREEDEFEQACRAIQEFASERLEGSIVQGTKNDLFLD